MMLLAHLGLRLEVASTAALRKAGWSVTYAGAVSYREDVRNTCRAMEAGGWVRGTRWRSVYGRLVITITN